MGRHLVSDADTQSQVISLVTETAITMGDYVKLGISGYVRRAADGIALALQKSAPGVTAMVPAAFVEAGGGVWGRNSFSAQFSLGVGAGQWTVCRSV